MRTLERQDSQTSTIAGGQDTLGAPIRVTLRAMRRARAWRRLGLLLLAGLLVLGALNFFGGRTSKTSASANGYQLEVSYPRTGRPGIGAPIQIQVHRHRVHRAGVCHHLGGDHLGAGPVLRFGRQHEAGIAGVILVPVVIVVIHPGRQPPHFYMVGRHGKDDANEGVYNAEDYYRTNPQLPT